MDYELRLVPASQSVNAGSTTSFDIYFTNNTQNALSYLTVDITTNRPILGNNPEQEGGATYSELNAISYVSGSQAVCTSIINNPEYGNYIDLSIYEEEGGPDITIPSGKIATVTLDIPNDMQSPLNFTFGIELEGTLYYGASAIVGSHDDFSFDATNTSVINPQPISITTVKLGPIANLRKSYGYVEDAYDTIETKGGTIPTDKNLANLSDAINSITGGDSGEAEDNDVIFIDYDGTRVYSYTADEFLALTEMPANPTHTGLTAQGWNWSLADAKTYVTNHGMLVIGQNYTTTSGATEIDVDYTEDGRSYGIHIELAESPTPQGTIDWGDGVIENLSDSQTHHYNSDSFYTIKINGSYKLYDNSFNNSSYDNPYVIKSIRIANGITELSQLSCLSMEELETIILPTSINSIKGGAIGCSPKLKAIVIPNGVTDLQDSNIGGYGSIISSVEGLLNNDSLKYISFPNGITTIGMYTFTNNYSLEKITLPDTVTALFATGDDEFETMSNLISLKDLCFGSNLTSLGNNSPQINLISNIINLQRTNSPEISGFNHNFYYDDATQNEFYMFNLKEFVDNNINTSLDTMANKWPRIDKIIFGSGFVSLGGGIVLPKGWSVLDFRKVQQVPIYNTGVTWNYSNNSIIIVPDSLYDQWIVATNWVNQAYRIVPASEV